MEKYSQFRDRGMYSILMPCLRLEANKSSTGSGIAPFFPVSSEPAGLYFPIYILLFFFKLPFLFTIAVTYFLFLQWFPLGSLVKKAILWMILGIPGIWWVVLQIDGVKKGSLAKKHEGRVPHPSDVIASSFTSPIDSLYLAAIFDPIFTVSYPHMRQVEQISLLGSIFRALAIPQEHPSPNAILKDLATIIAENPERCIVVFPECTTTNGRAILPLSPSLLTAPPGTKIFPVSLRYTPPDITTPIPGTYVSFLWNLLSQPTHCIRVRIAEAVYNTSSKVDNGTRQENKYLANILDQLVEKPSVFGNSDIIANQDDLAAAVAGGNVSEEGKRVLDKVADALARLGRVKRVGLTVSNKLAFNEAWSEGRR